MRHRLAFLATDRHELRWDLASAAKGESPASGCFGQAGSGKTAWVFTGMDAPRPGLIRDLCAAWPAFSDALEVCAKVLVRGLDRPLRPLLWASPESADAALLHQATYSYPAVFAFQVALGQLWRSWHPRPAVLAGEGIGALAAAHVAGAISLEDAARLACAMGRVADGVVEHEVLESLAAEVPENKPDLPLMITPGSSIIAEVLASVRSGVSVPSQRARLLAELGTSEVAFLVELGPSPTLQAQLAAHPQIAWVPLVREEGRASHSVLRALGDLWTAGASIHWSQVFPEGGYRPLLPTYPWQRKRYWLDRAPREDRDDTADPSLSAIVELLRAENGAAFAAQLGLTPSSPEQAAVLAQVLAALRTTTQTHRRPEQRRPLAAAGRAADRSGGLPLW